MNYKINLLKFGGISGISYQNNKITDTVVIYGIGAPTVPDNGSLPDAPVIEKFGIYVFVPDYIAFGRSDGSFSAKNCIKTFLELYRWFSEGRYGVCYYNHAKIFLKYKRIIFIGRSLTGAYIPLLPKYNNNIKELAIFYPAVDQKNQGEIKGKETNTDFLNSLTKDGYHHLYRNINYKTLSKYLNNEDGLSPIDNIQHLKNSKLFITHGKKDKCIHYSKTISYYKKILKNFPSNGGRFKFNLYPKGGHDHTTTQLAVSDFLKWIL